MEAKINLNKLTVTLTEEVGFTELRDFIIQVFGEELIDQVKINYEYKHNLFTRQTFPSPFETCPPFKPYDPNINQPFYTITSTDKTP